MDIEATAGRSWEWIGSNFGLMDPYSHKNRDKFEFCVKVLAELAFVMSRPKYLSDTSGIRSDLSRRMFDAYTRTGFQAFLLQHLGKLPGLSLTASLQTMGYVDRTFLRRIELCDLPTTITSGEYAPAMFMDIAHSAMACGLPWSGPSLPDLLERSLLNATPDVTWASDSEYYAITHAVFFATDFGRAPAAVPSHISRYVDAVFDLICFELVSRTNWDLLGEFLMCVYYLDLPPRPAFDDYLEMFMASQCPDGSFQNGVSADGETEWSVFLEKYHTTFVALLTMAAREDRPRHG